MGEEKLDVAVYTIRGLRDLADLARSRGDRATASWALERARDLERRFEAEWWMPEVPQHADSLADPGNAKLQQRHWIGAIPMEAELVRGGRIVPGLATFPHGEAALALRETRCYSGDFGLFHTGIPGCDPVAGGTGERKVFTLNTAIMAVGEGNYGRLGPDQQGRYTAGNRRLQLPDAGRAAGRDARDRAVARLRAARSTSRSSTARWSCRRGAPTAPPGPWCASSSACGPTWDATASRSCRRCRTAKAASPARTSDSASPAPPTSGRATQARAM